MGHMLGVFEGANQEELMRDALVACMGWMVDAHDHSAHEILLSAKSFGLSYTPGPESYKQIRPGDEAFLARLKEAQARRGFKMPDEYLKADYVQQVIEQLMEKKSSQPPKDPYFSRWQSATTSTKDEPLPPTKSIESDPIDIRSSPLHEGEGLLRACFSDQHVETLALVGFLRKRVC